MDFLEGKNANSKTRIVEKAIYKNASTYGVWSRSVRKTTILDLYDMIREGTLVLNSPIYYDKEVPNEKIIAKLSNLVWITVHRNNKLKEFLNDLS